MNGQRKVSGDRPWLTVTASRQMSTPSTDDEDVETVAGKLVLIFGSFPSEQEVPIPRWQADYYCALSYPSSP